MNQNCEDSKIWSRYLLSNLLLIYCFNLHYKVEFAYAEDLENIYEYKEKQSAIASIFRDDYQYFSGFHSSLFFYIHFLLLPCIILGTQLGK